MAPSSVFKSRALVGGPLAAIIAAAILVFGAGLAASPAHAQAGGIDRSVIPMAPDAPERYVVQRGDTLWDISARFLRDPWYWPEIWYINPEVANPHLIYPGDVLVLTWVDGQPRLSLERGGDIRLSPRVREQPLSEAIRAIPWRVVQAFMSRPTVLAREQVENAPYVVTARDRRLITAAGDEVYARRLDGTATGTEFLVYHVGDELKDPEDGDVLGYEGIYTATGSATRTGDPTTLRLTESTRETRDGDILIGDTVDVGMDFIPRPPAGSVEGVVMDVVDDRIIVGEYQVVVINRGARDGLEPGNVLSVWRAGEEIKDTTPNRESRKVTLPDERIAEFMVFKSWERLSFGLILDSVRELQVGDLVRNP